MTPLERNIEFLRVVAAAGAHSVPALVKGLETLPRVHLDEAGLCAMTLSVNARALTRELLRCDVDAMSALQRAIGALADTLQQQMNARAPKLRWDLRGGA